VDLTLILLVVLLVIVVVVFILALRGGRRGENVPAAGQVAEQQPPVRPAIAAPQGQAPEGGAADAPSARRLATAAPPAPSAQVTTTATTTREAPTAPTAPTATARPVAPAQAATGAVAEAPRPHAEAPVARHGPEPDGARVRNAAWADDRVIVRGVPVVERGGPALETNHALPTMSEAAAAGGARVAGDAGNVRSAGDTRPASVATTGAPPVGLEAATAGVTAAAATDAAPVAPSTAPTSVDGATTNSAPAMELVVQPPTRTGAVMLSVAPQRLPFRLAELLGEQRGLEEAITIAHRRIDDVELGPDPGAAENRVRLAVLRQDLTQKQERLREILFLQDGYRWVQQHMAPDHAPGEG